MKLSEQELKRELSTRFWKKRKAKNSMQILIQFNSGQVQNIAFKIL